MTIANVVDTKHPDWIDRQDERAIVHHSARGADAVKGEGNRYLPMPSGFRVQDDGGKAMYRAYQRSRWW